MMSYKGSNGNFDAALIQLIRKLSDASNYFSGERSEVRKFARSLLRDWDHTRGTDWYTSTNKEEGMMSQTVPLHAADSAAPEVDLSSDERVAALCDLSYCAGLKAGWNYCTDGDHAGFARSMESAREAVAVLNEHRLKGAPDAQVARAEQEPVATILPPDPLDERTGPWLSLEDWERLRALPSGTRLYATQQPAEQPATDVDMLVEHERKLFEARMRRVAPGVNLEMIGDRYNDLDTQWKFELWLDRAALAAQHDASGLVRALEKIANWADGGSEYGQDKIKAFARSALANKGVVGGIRGW